MKKICLICFCGAKACPVPPGFGAPPGFSGAGESGEAIDPKDAFFIQAEVDKSEAYVGEQVTASWYLYTRGMIRDLDTLKYPALKGFWKEDIRNRHAPQLHERGRERGGI